MNVYVLVRQWISIDLMLKNAWCYDWSLWLDNTYCNQLQSEVLIVPWPLIGDSCSLVHMFIGQYICISIISHACLSSDLNCILNCYSIAMWRLVSTTECCVCLQLLHLLSTRSAWYAQSIVTCRLWDEYVHLSCSIVLVMLFTFQACIVNVIENSLYCPGRVSLYLEDAKRLAPIFCEHAFWQSLCIYDACDICPEWVIELVRKRPMKVYVFVTTWISSDSCRKTKCYVVSLLWLTTHVETNYWVKSWQSCVWNSQY